MIHHENDPQNQAVYNFLPSFAFDVAHYSAFLWRLAVIILAINTGAFTTEQTALPGASQIQKKPEGCYTEKRKKSGKTTAPHANIKKKRTLANCTITGWKSPAVTTCLGSFGFTLFTPGKPQLKLKK
ncbi:putative G-protein coupled receptor 34 isoform X2 [Microtus pennsylvanicus]|uniref:putative G-protein coupled receptor 34 isoform X2 n=1 Tax=Microtus pennsylvanicus TaxID=10058 RepID=UPI003F6C3419